MKVYFDPSSLTAKEIYQVIFNFRRLAMPSRVAIVTGGNKGIGYAIVRGLAKQFTGDVFLTARDAGRGMAAVSELLEKEKLKVHFHQLDINDTDSIQRLHDFMKQNYEGIDVLVNNAGIAFKNAATESMGVQAEVTIKTNFYAVKSTCDILFPILKPGARVVNLSSSAGWLKQLQGRLESKELLDKFASSGSTLTVKELEDMMEQFIAAAKDGTAKEKGFPGSTYATSKIGLSALSRIQQQEFDKDPNSDLVVNHVHPGYVDTDMTSHKGPLTIDEGAKSSLFAALLPPLTEVKGQYIWEDCQVRDWING